MGVVIDEVTAETGGETRGGAAAPAAAGTGAGAEPDLDALDYRQARRRQRIRRLWAD